MLDANESALPMVTGIDQFLGTEMRISFHYGFEL